MQAAPNHNSEALPAFTNRNNVIQLISIMKLSILDSKLFSLSFIVNLLSLLLTLISKRKNFFLPLSLKTLIALKKYFIFCT